MRGIDRSVAFLCFALALCLGTFLYITQFLLRGSHFSTLPSGMLLHDFAFFWGGARLFWLDRVGQIFNPEQFNAWLSAQIAPDSMPEFSTWSYPPTMLLMLLPFGLLPLPVAFVLWIIVTLTMLALVLRYALGNRWVALAVLLSPATSYSIYYGQNGALTAALLIAGIWLADRRPTIAGACIGLLVIKPQLGILLPFALAAGGYWRVFAVASLVALMIFAATIFLFGLNAWNGFFSETMPIMTAQLLHDYGIAPQYAMPTVWVTLQGWSASVRLATFGQSLSTITTIAVVIRAWWVSCPDPRWRNALTCALPLLATPFGYVYDSIPIMLAVALVAQVGLSDGVFAWPERPVLVGVWVWPTTTVFWTFFFGLRPMGGFLLLAFALCLLWRLERGFQSGAFSR